jgi:hypothetical protein
VKNEQIDPFHVSWKPETSSCEDSAQFRIHLNRLDAGIDLHNELRLNVRGHKNNIDIFVSRATHEAHRDHMLKSEQYNVGLFDVVRLAVNPFNLIDGIRRITASLEAFKITFHVHPDCLSDDFVSNNLGSRHISISAKGSDYFKIVESAIDDLRSIPEVSEKRIAILIVKSKGDFWTPAQRQSYEADKTSKASRKQLKPGKTASGNL